MNNKLAQALGTSIEADTNRLRKAVSKIGIQERPALRVAIESLMHELGENPSPELEADIGVFLKELGGEEVVSNESLVAMEGKTAEVLYGIWRGIWGGHYARKDAKDKAAGKETFPERRAREKREEEERKRLASKNYNPKEIVDILNKTFGNKSWVEGCTQVEGGVSAQGISLYIRNTNSWVTSDAVAVLKKDLGNLKKLRDTLMSDGVRYGNAVIEVVNTLNPLIEANCKKNQYNDLEPIDDAAKKTIVEAYGKAIKKLKGVKHPEQFLKPFFDTQLPGGVLVEGTDWGTYFDRADKPSGEGPVTLPALDKDKVVELAKITIEIFNIANELKENDRRYQVVHYHDDGDAINDMYDLIDLSEDLYAIFSDQTPNEIFVESLLETCMEVVKAAFTYMDRSVREVK